MTARVTSRRGGGPLRAAVGGSRLGLGAFRSFDFAGRAAIGEQLARIGLHEHAGVAGNRSVGDAFAISLLTRDDRTRCLVEPVHIALEVADDERVAVDRGRSQTAT